MKQCFRIALWMFLLTGYLQGQPINKDCFSMTNLGFKALHSVSCKNNVTFKAPTNVERACYAKALEDFEKGMMVAQNNCDNVDHTSNTLEALGSNCLNHTQTNCNSTYKVHQEFRSFVDATKAFVQQVNDDQRSRKQ